MTDPLIDRNALRDRLQDWTPLMPEGAADVAMAYLRSVLTPEALNPRQGRGDAEIDAWWLAIGHGLHRRIFGEDE